MREKRKLNERNCHGKKQLRVKPLLPVLCQPRLIRARDDVRLVHFSFSAVDRILSFADPEIIIVFTSDKSARIAADVQFIDAASVLYSAVYHMYQVFRFRIIAIDRFNIAVASVFRYGKHTAQIPVVSPVIIDSVKIICIKNPEGFGEYKIPPVLAPRPSETVLIVHIHTAVEAAGKTLLIVF